MENTLNIAICFVNLFQSKFELRIDEMKLHKLMYFAQRESFIQSGKPLFDATFYGWKYGPILKEVRDAYREGAVFGHNPDNFSESCSNEIVSKVFEEYGGRDSWSLSRLTHGELSWKNSRIGVAEDDNSDRPMSDEDIQKDAERVKARREMLVALGLG